MEIPTRQFRVEGFKGKFSVDKKPAEMVGGGKKYSAYWNKPGGGPNTFESAAGITREQALKNVIARGLAKGMK